METRPFGNTGESFPILSFGGQRIVDEHNCTEEEAVEILSGLRRKVQHSQKQLEKWQVEVEKHTPPSLRKSQDISEQNRGRLADFVAAVESIEI